MSELPAGAIHDIGFRRYEGERLGRRWAFRSLLVETVRGSFGFGRGAKAKALPITVMVMFFFPVAFLIVGLFIFPELPGEGLPLVTYSEFAASSGFWMTVFFATRAPIAVSRDLRSGVLPLYFSRPLARGDYVWARLGGVSIAGFIMLAIPMLVMLIASLLDERPVLTELAAAGRGFLTAAVVAAVIGSICVFFAAHAPRRGWGVAIIVTTFILANGISEAIYGITSGAASTVRLLDPYDAISAWSQGILGSDVGDNAPLIPGGLAGGVMGGAIILALFSAAVVLTHLRYRKVGAQ